MLQKQRREKERADFEQRREKERADFEREESSDCDEAERPQPQFHILFPGSRGHASDDCIGDEHQVPDDEVARATNIVTDDGAPADHVDSSNSDSTYATDDTEDDASPTTVPRSVPRTIELELEAAPLRPAMQAQVLRIVGYISQVEARCTN